MRLTVLLILFFQTIVKAKASFGSLTALPKFKKRCELVCFFYKNCAKSSHVEWRVLVVLLSLSIFQKLPDAQDLHVLKDFITTKNLRMMFSCLIKFWPHFIQFSWNKGFQRFMETTALGVSAETKDNALTGIEYMQKKQRTDASKVTNPWLMGIFCSKDMFLRVWELHTFLRTLAKLPVWKIEFKIQPSPRVGPGFK